MPSSPQISSRSDRDDSASRARLKRRGSYTSSSSESSDSEDDRRSRRHSRRRRSSRHSSSSGSESDSSSSSSDEEDYRRREKSRSEKRRRIDDSEEPSKAASAVPAPAAPVLDREAERQRQRDERYQRSERGLPTEKPVLRTQETTQDIMNKVKTGGVYIPPFKLRRVQEYIKDPKSIEFQRTNWDTLKKSINGLVNKVTVSNIKNIIPEIFKENIIRGRGLLIRSLMKAYAASPEFTHVYAALVSVLNTKLPELGELLLKRLIIAFRRAYYRNDKVKCYSNCKFLAHLVNQQVCHEILAGQMLGLLLERPTDDSVELAVNFTKDCGYTLLTVAPKILNAVFERFRSVLHEGYIDKRVYYMIEGLFAVRKTTFKDHPSILPDLDLVEKDDQITHELELDQYLTYEDQLDYFHFDPDFEENEAKFKAIRSEILGEESDDDDAPDGGFDDGDDEDEEGGAHGMSLADDSTRNIQQEVYQQYDEYGDIMNFKKTIYLAIMSSVDFQECAHKILKTGLCRGREMELCSMIVECCSYERTYMRFYGLLAYRFCYVDRVYRGKFEECFQLYYGMIHRLETNKLRNVAKLFAHLMYSDVISWSVLEFIRLTQDDTTSSSRIFIKILFQELVELMGLKALHERLNDPLLKEHFAGLFPTDHPKNIRFAINYWTSIGLGGLTEELRAVLVKAASK